MKFCASLLIVLFSHLAFSQSHLLDSAQRQIYKGYVSSSLSDWQEGIRLMEKIRKTRSDDFELSYQLGLAYYGLIGYCNSTKNCTDLLQKIEQAQELVKKLLQKYPESSSYSALMGGLIAMEIEQKPTQMIFLGPTCTRYINESVSKAPENPIAWVEKGNLRYHSPGIFGGDRKEAIACFERAINLFDKYPSLKKNSWQYLHAWAWLGKAYLEEGKQEEARKVFQKVLKIEPDFLWVKNELLPSLRK
jgi:tetratricopeptide (TPR) repeat protein